MSQISMDAGVLVLERKLSYGNPRIERFYLKNIVNPCLPVYAA